MWKTLCGTIGWKSWLETWVEKLVGKLCKKKVLKSCVEKYCENCKKKTSESVKKLWEDPEHKERMRASLRRGWEKRRLRNLQQKV